MPDHGFEVGELGLPAQVLSRQRGVGYQSGRIADSPRGVVHSNRPASDANGGVDHFLDGKSVAVA
jgi:hypothetical protein